ncbi:hypothetical protein Agub_g15204 [Astrephomene gubernaculifera]|uniref:Uncharacterized protein n=1 Tax=Astrephomene gubernaculifera TaxID=47775 RepID=A0AAD3E6M1_9CHLO|nr:hypothetical protein Agub_g15204 [Astrephomene gubernaculifera]
MFISNSNILGQTALSTRGWVVIHVRRSHRTWGCERRRSQVHCSARSGKRGAGELHDPWREEERRQALLNYVREVQPQSVAQFAEQTHPVVVQAMRQTVLNVVGSLPPQYFDVRISTMAESLAQLMLSIMTTGYMLRSAQFRLELQKSLKQLSSVSSAPSAEPAAIIEPPAISIPAIATTTTAAYTSSSSSSTAASPPSSPLTTFDDASNSSTTTTGTTASSSASASFLHDGEGSPYAPGVQKKGLAGEVLRWHLGRGEVERLGAGEYIEMLERELAALRAQVSSGAFPPGTPAAASAPMPPPPPPPPPPSASTPAGTVEVLGPYPSPSSSYKSSSSSSSSSLSGPPSQELVCVSPLPGFGERDGPGVPYISTASDGSISGMSGALAPSPAANSAAAPATMGCGGIPLVVGSPLGLPRNELLDYLHGLQAGGSGSFKELACSPSTSSGQAVKEAMELFVARLMGTADPEALTKLNSEFSSVELSKVLFWLMAVGYTLKSIEARLDMEDGMGGSSSGGGGGGGGLSPGGGRGGGNGSSSGGNNGSSRGSSSKGKNERKGGFGGLRGLLPGF